MESPVTRTELQSDILRVRDDLQQHYATKADLSDLETKLSDMLHGQTRWTVGAIIAVGAIAVTILRLT